MTISVTNFKKMKTKCRGGEVRNTEADRIKFFAALKHKSVEASVPEVRLGLVEHIRSKRGK